MSEDVPSLLPSSSEAIQMAQVLLFARDALQRARARRGRLAYSDAEHTDQVEEALSGPAPLRLMTDEEQAEWAKSWDATFTNELRAASPGEPFVWAAPLPGDAGGFGGEWGVECRTFDQAGAPTGTIFLACRDLRDANGMYQHLRANATPKELARLQDWASGLDAMWNNSVAPAPSAEASAGGEPTPTRATRPQPVQLRLTEQQWISELQKAFPDSKAAGLRALLEAANPRHPHHKSWRSLHSEANREVAVAGADPAKLAGIVANAGWYNWHNAPGLAKFMIVEARRHPDYAERVRPRAAAAQSAVPVQPAREAGATAQPPAVGTAARDVTHPGSAPTAPEVPQHLAEVRSPEAALAWAQHLDRDSAEDLAEAKVAIRRWGSDVDEVLVEKFPSILEAEAATVRRERAKKSGDAEAAVVAVSSGTGQSQQDHVQWASNLDAKSRVGAQYALRPSNPEVNYALFLRMRELREQSGRTEPDAVEVKFEEKFFSLHPDGEAEAAAWRSRAQADEQRAAVAMAVPDVSATPAREDVISQGEAAGERGQAAAEFGVAAAVMSRRSVTPSQVPGQRRTR
jgi:hypothetical protein